MTLEAGKKTIWMRRLRLFLLIAIVWIAMELGLPAFLRLVQRLVQR